MCIKLCRNSDKSIGDCSTNVLQFILQLNLMQVRDAKGSVGRSRSSDEVSVMGMERRASVIQSDYFKTTCRGGEDDERNDKAITC